MRKTKVKKWIMPAWMEKYRKHIVNTGGNGIEELMNDHGSTLDNNSVRVMLIVAVKSQVALLNILRNELNIIQ